MIEIGIDPVAFVFSGVLDIDSHWYWILGGVAGALLVFVLLVSALVEKYKLDDGSPLARALVIGPLVLVAAIAVFCVLTLDFTIRWYGIIAAIGTAVVIGLPLLWARGKDIGVTRDQILSAAPWCLIGGVVFSRLIHVIDQWHLYYPDNLRGIIGFQGMGIFGAIIGATLVGVAYGRIRGFPVGRIADLVAPAVILGQAIGRVGCNINGCCYGKPSDLPWAVFYSHPSSEAMQNGVTQAVHPTAAYELIWDLIVFGILWSLRGRLKREGALFLVYLIAYSVGRLFISVYRDNDPFLFGLVEAQVVSILVLLVSVPMLVWLYKRRPPETAPAESQDNGD
jgi:phosphatidylglycerol:prolipoprotein diacylglycerol transferase